MIIRWLPYFPSFKMSSFKKFIQENRKGIGASCFTFRSAHSNISQKLISFLASFRFDPVDLAHLSPVFFQQGVFAATFNFFFIFYNCLPFLYIFFLFAFLLLLDTLERTCLTLVFIWYIFSALLPSLPFPYSLRCPLRISEYFWSSH